MLGTDNLSLALCDIQQINKDGKIIKKAKAKKHLKTGNNEWNFVLNDILKHGSFNGCALLIPKKAFDDSGYFDETLRYSQDVFMWIKIFLNKYNVVYVHNIGVSSRVHSRQLTQTGRALFHSDSAKMSEYIIPKLIEQKYAREFLYSYALHNAVLNNKKVVKNCLIKSKTQKTLSFGQKAKIKLASFYGSLRPIVRKIYYKLFRKIKTT